VLATVSTRPNQSSYTETLIDFNLTHDVYNIGSSTSPGTPPRTLICWRARMALTVQASCLALSTWAAVYRGMSSSCRQYTGAHVPVVVMVAFYRVQRTRDEAHLHDVLLITKPHTWQRTQMQHLGIYVYRDSQPLVAQNLPSIQYVTHGVCMCMGEGGFQGADRAEHSRCHTCNICCRSRYPAFMSAPAADGVCMLLLVYTRVWWRGASGADHTYRLCQMRDPLRSFAANNNNTLHHPAFKSAAADNYRDVETGVTLAGEMYLV
jgi:hypothetical protein